MRFVVYAKIGLTFVVYIVGVAPIPKRHTLYAWHLLVGLAPYNIRRIHRRYDDLVLRFHKTG